MEIKTNNVPRDVVEAYELPIDVRGEFDYLDWTNIEMVNDTADFVRYKGWWYNLAEFRTTGGMGLPDEFKKWDGYHSDTFFSGILIKYVDNFERVIMGRYYA